MIILESAEKQEYFALAGKKRVKVLYTRNQWDNHIICFLETSLTFLLFLSP